MTGEEMERAIQFLIEHHAKVSTDIEGLKETQATTTAIVSSLADSVSQLAALAEADRREMRETSEGLFEQMREGFDKLILSNEVTRDLANQVAGLAVATAQRVTAIEETLR